MREILSLCCVVLLGSVPTGAIFAQTIVTGGGDKSFVIMRDEASIEVDGILAEDVWNRATLIDDLHQIEPVEFSEPSQRTEIRIFYGDDALYIGARLFDSEAQNITANVLRQGEDLGSEDRFTVILDPFLDRRSGYRFELNPNSVRWDGLYQDTTRIESNWDGIWQGAATRDDEGWTAEFLIPFKTLSINRNSNDWGINFERSVQRVGETIGWVSRNRQLNPGVAGMASGFESVQQGRGLDIVPSVSVRRAQTYTPPGTSTPGSSNSDTEPSLDIFYKVTPSLNAALTINTDFSATEVDDRQVNLTRFSLFFPEKRDFFLQDADIFEFGRIGGQSGAGGGFEASRNFSVPNSSFQNARPFFSRRLGLSATGEPVDIEAGAKLSGRVGRWNVGSLLIRQDQFQAVEASDIFVGRVAANVLEESAVGVIMTDGDPRSNLDSSLVGTDFRYRNSRLPGGKLLQAQAWYQQTDNEGVDGEDRAYGAGFSVPSTQGWRYGAEVKVIEANFRPAVGFVDRVGVRDYQANFAYEHRFSDTSRAIRSMTAGIDYYRLDRLDTGELDTEIVGLRPFEINSNTNDRFYTQYTLSHEVLLVPFRIYRAPDSAREVFVPAGDYRYKDFRIGGRSGQQRRVSVGGRLSSGEFYDGTSDSFNVNLDWRPSERFRFRVSYNMNDVELPDGNFTTRLSSLRAEYVFSSTLSWVNLIQYDNISENVGINSRLHWIPQAGREGFIVFNHNLIDTDRNDSFHSTSADVSVKFSYTVRL